MQVDSFYVYEKKKHHKTVSRGGEMRNKIFKKKSASLKAYFFSLARAFLSFLLCTLWELSDENPSEIFWSEADWYGNFFFTSYQIKGERKEQMMHIICENWKVGVWMMCRTKKASLLIWMKSKRTENRRMIERKVRNWKTWKKMTSATLKTTCGNCSFFSPLIEKNANKVLPEQRCITK